MIGGAQLNHLARELALVMHEGQSRKGSGEPYVNHVFRVANRVTGWKARTVAYLHDIVEDTDLTLDDLRKLRFPAYIVDAVDLLSRREGETYREFIDRCANGGNRVAWEVKLADLKDNLSDIDLVPGGANMREKRYAEPYARFTALLYGSED